jgi:hypothetical protein
VTEGGGVGKLSRLAARGYVFHRYVLEREERAGAKLLDQLRDGVLDALDEVGAVVDRAKPGHGKSRWHLSSFDVY